MEELNPNQDDIHYNKGIMIRKDTQFAEKASPVRNRGAKI